MSSRIKNKFSELKALRSAKPRVRRALLSDRELVLAVIEVIINVLNGNVKLGAAEKKKLERYRGQLRKLAGKGSVKSKQKLIQQKGGFLSTLLPPAIALLASLIK